MGSCIAVELYLDIGRHNTPTTDDGNQEPLLYIQPFRRRSMFRRHSIPLVDIYKNEMKGGTRVI